ncbi:MAG: hypothetical protein M3252_00675, partial [Actinomycetota bacterium]|nr:hypothetical protein [Actinomycetota bacterium]
MRGLAPAALQDHYLASLRQVIRGFAAGGPLVVVCEDLHWADASSVEALAKLLSVVDEVAVLLALTGRPNRDSPGWDLVSEARRRFGEALLEVPLSSLSEGASRQLIGHLLEIESLPERTRTLLLSKTEGNPFFVEEVVRMLIDRGALERRGDTWVASAEVASLDIPDTVHGLLLARIDQLPTQAKRTLKVASLVGRQFPVGVVEEVLHTTAGLDDDRLDLTPLEASGLIRLDTVEPELEYAFRHALIQEAAYQSVLKQERRLLHQAVGEVLERRYPDRHAELAAVLAHHFEQAGAIERAVDHLIAAGQYALQRFANPEAHGFFSQALAHLPTGDDDPRTLRRRVEAGLGWAQAGASFIPYDEELQHLEAIMPAAEALGDQRLLALLHLQIALARQRAGEQYLSSEAMQYALDRAREIGEALEDPWLTALPMAVLGEAKVWAAEFHDAIRLLEQATVLLEEREDLTRAAWYLGMLAVAYARLGEFPAADEAARREGAIASHSGDPNALLDAELTRGLVETVRGNLDEAVTLTQRGVAIAEEVGNIACEFAGNFFLGDQHLRMGRPDEAVPALERCGELARYWDAGGIENL